MGEQARRVLRNTRCVEKAQQVADEVSRLEQECIDAQSLDAATDCLERLRTLVEELGEVEFESCVHPIPPVSFGALSPSLGEYFESWKSSELDPVRLARKAMEECRPDVADWALGDERILDWLHALERQFTDGADGWELSADALTFGLAYFYFRAFRYQETIELLREFKSERVKRSWCMFLMGLCLHHSVDHDSELAIIYLRAAADVPVESEGERVLSSYLYLGLILFVRSRARDSLAVLERLHKLSPDYPHLIEVTAIIRQHLAGYPHRPDAA